MTTDQKIIEKRRMDSINLDFCSRVQRKKRWNSGWMSSSLRSYWLIHSPMDTE